MAATPTVDVICPPHVRAGSLITVTIPSGDIEVEVPAGVTEGDVFTVQLGDVEEQEREPPGGLGAIAAELAGQRAIAASFFHSEPAPVANGEVLAEALRTILKAIDRMPVIDELIESNAASFADYSSSAEQSLTWTALHHKFVELIELAAKEQMEDLECSDSELFAFARDYGETDPAARSLLRKFLAMGEYLDFCSLMQAAHRRAPGATVGACVVRGDV